MTKMYVILPNSLSKAFYGKKNAPVLAEAL